MMLTRFRTDDPRPTRFPEHPYWVWDAEEYYVVISYTDNWDYVLYQWPNAQGVSILEETDEYDFSGSLQKPRWWP